MSSFPLLEFWLRRPWRKRICVTLSVQFPLLPTVVLLCTELWEPAQTGVCKGSRTDCHLRDSVFSVYSQALWTANSTDQRGDKLIYIREILIPLLTCHISSTIQKQNWLCVVGVLWKIWGGQKQRLKNRISLMGETKREKCVCMTNLRLLFSSEAALSCHSLGIFCAVACRKWSWWSRIYKTDSILACCAVFLGKFCFPTYKVKYPSMI